MHQLGAEFPSPFALVPWRHHVEIITKCKSIDEALFYMGKTIEQGLSRNALINCIKANLYEHQGRIANNFSDHLPALQSKLVQEVLKENYDFGFATVEHEIYDEDEMEAALTRNVTDLLLEMGTGFAIRCPPSFASPTPYQNLYDTPLRLKTNTVSFTSVPDLLVTAQFLDFCHCGADAVKNLLHHDLADDVVDLAAGEVVVGSQLVAVVIGEPGKLTFPDALFGLLGRLSELDFEEETASESTVEIFGEVGGGDEDAVEFLALPEPTTFAAWFFVFSSFFAVLISTLQK